MSRSRRKTPMLAMTRSESEKADKRLWHRRFRRTVRHCLRKGREDLPHFRDISNPWNMAKDGRRFGRRSWRAAMPLWKTMMK